MLQMSKLIRARKAWRRKAVQRAEQVRELKKAKRRYQDKITELKRQITELEANKKTEAEQDCRNALSSHSNMADLSAAEQNRVLCVLLVIQGVVSYRSTPRILALFNGVAMPESGRVPHFTSVINWVLRLGLGLLKQVKPCARPWLAILDRSIDIGTKKALVVLRVSADVLSRKGSAVLLQDCECIGLSVSETVNGDRIALELDDIFEQAGTPAAIIKDCDRTLNKGVSLWQNKHNTDIPVIDDISHVMAAAMKKQFEGTEDYKQFTSFIGKGAKNLRQTAFAFLAPPKLRTKGRFLSIGRIGRRGTKMLDALNSDKDPQNGGILNKLRSALPGFDAIEPFIRCFANTADAVYRVMGTLKNKGLNRATYAECHRLAKAFPDDSQVRQSLLAWLERHIRIKEQITDFPLLISSDIIESLFGRFKYMLERNPQADMNRSVLLIPALCGSLNETTIGQALSSARHDALEKWEQENIPYTMRRKRREFFSGIKPKTGEA